MNLSIIALGLVGGCVYLMAMSALGRRLAACREATTIPLAPPPISAHRRHETISA